MGLLKWGQLPGELTHVVGSALTQRESGLCPGCGLEVEGGGEGIVIMAPSSPALTLCASVGRKALGPRCAEVSAPESGAGGPP